MKIYYYGHDLETCSHGLDKSPKYCIGLSLLFQGPYLNPDVVYNRSRFFLMKEKVIFPAENEYVC